MKPEKKPEDVANLEAERQLLGLLLTNNEVYWQVAGFLAPEHFFLHPHKEIYQIAADLIMAKQKADPLTIKTYLEAPINYKPPLTYLLQLIKDPATLINARDYGHTIVSLALRREILDGALVLSDQARTAKVTEPVSNILENAEQIIANIRHKVPGALKDQTSISAVSEESLEHLAFTILNPDNIYPTIGLKGVTHHIGPLSPGAVYVIAGRPGSGKTAAGVAAARSIIRQKNPQNSHFGVIYFTLEVTRRDLWNRFIACEMARSYTPVEYMNLKRGIVSNVELQAIENAAKALNKFPLFIHDKSGLTINQIYVAARAEKQKLMEKGLDLHVVVVDYLQIIRPSGRYMGNKVAEISDISIGLLSIAKDLNVAVIALSQLSRKVEEREDKRPVMSDLRESGQIEQDANSIIFLYRPAYYDSQKRESQNTDFVRITQSRRNHIHYIIAKARDGTPGEVINYCEIGLNHIRDK